ncbi:hypothetical protein CBM2623_A10108 [Cupriavidus taiwanensis]|nr:hypothetical protein CBM2623_A10108 [Cupriavidus taiwanensis]
MLPVLGANILTANVQSHCFTAWQNRSFIALHPSRAALSDRSPKMEGSDVGASKRKRSSCAGRHHVTVLELGLAEKTRQMAIQLNYELRIAKHNSNRLESVCKRRKWDSHAIPVSATAVRWQMDRNCRKINHSKLEYYGTQVPQMELIVPKYLGCFPFVTRQVKLTTLSNTARLHLDA